jgi:hypothetical protein
MTFLKTLTTALVGLSFVAAAHAEERTFQARFEYSKSAPASVTYSSIQDQAAIACNREARGMPLAGPANRYRWTRTCTDQLVGKAVDAIGNVELLALHNKSAPPSQVAAR